DNNPAASLPPPRASRPSRAPRPPKTSTLYQTGGIVPGYRPFPRVSLTGSTVMEEEAGPMAPRSRRWIPILALALALVLGSGYFAWNALRGGPQDPGDSFEGTTPREGPQMPVDTVEAMDASHR